MFNKLITAFGSKQDSNQPETKEDEAARLRNEMYAAFGNTSAPAWRASRPTTAATSSRPTTAARPDSAAGRPKPLETPKTPMLGAKKVSPTSILSSGETQWSGSSAQSAASSRPSSKQSTRSSVDGGAPMRSPRESGDTGNSQPVPSRTTRASEPSGRPASRGVAAPVTPIRLSMARAGSTDTAACKAVAQTSLTSPKRYCRASADGVVCSAQDDSLSLHLQPHRSARGPVGESSIGSSSSATYGYVAERPSSGTRASPCLIQAGLATRPSQPAASAAALNRAGSLGGWQKMPVVA